MPKRWQLFENYSRSYQNKLKRDLLDRLNDDEDGSITDNDDDNSSLPSPKRARNLLLSTQGEVPSHLGDHDIEIHEPAIDKTDSSSSSNSNSESADDRQSLVSSYIGSTQDESAADSESLDLDENDDGHINSDIVPDYIEIRSCTSQSDNFVDEVNSSDFDDSSDDASQSSSTSSNASSPFESADLDYEFNNADCNRENENHDEPLYDGAPLTVSEHLLATLNLALRHNITGVLLTDILGLLALHCPPENKCKTSLYTFKKCFSEMSAPLIRHYYCISCHEEMRQKDSICESCPESKNSYFIEGQVIAQIKALYKRPSFKILLQHRHTKHYENEVNYTDIYNADVYRELSQPGAVLDNPDNISLTFYTDGISIFKSSKLSIWVVYLVINELPFSERFKKENVLIAGLWFGDEKPDPNLFLKPLHESITELNQHIEVEVPDSEDPLKIKASVICVTCDLPAKALFYNMNQYNGRFGCQICTQEGVYLQDHRVRVWPYERIRLRTDEETKVHSKEAFAMKTAVCGVKGPTVLSFIVHNPMKAIAVDVMHCSYEGIVKSMANFWFSPSFSDHPSSLIEHLELVDQRLKAFTPPSSVQRHPRSIKNHLSYWKAHEFKCWFFYYSIPCVSSIMEPMYFMHYQLLLLGVSLLSQTSVSPDELEIASRALHKYVAEYEELYGLRHMSNNVHQLLHLPETVRRFGPLWTTSCFPFEDLNGRLKSMVHGSNSAQLQIFSTASMHMHLSSLKSEKLEKNRPAYTFCENLDSKRGRIKRDPITDAVYIVGKCTELQGAPTDIDQVLQRANVHGTKYSYYQKLLKHKIMFTSTEYRRNGRTDSSFATYSDRNGSSRIGRIRCFVKVSDCDCLEPCDCIVYNYAILRPYCTKNQFVSAIDNIPLSRIHTLLRLEDDDQAVEITSLISVCFYCNVQDTSVKYVIEPVNLVEFE